MIVIGPEVKCATCGGTKKGTPTDELVYYATKALDEPWQCRDCRRHI